MSTSETMNTVLVVAVLAGLGVGVYYLYKNFKDFFGTVGETAKIAVEGANTQLGPTSPGGQTLTPLKFAVPITTIPYIVDVLKQPIGGTKTAIAKTMPSYAAFLFPPLGIYEGFTKIPVLLGETKKMLGW